MCYNNNAQGGHELLHLHTNALIQRCQVMPVPITPAIIKHVHTVAKQEGMPVGLKMILNRSSQLFYDAALIAGVDYNNEEAFNNEVEEDYSDKDSKQNDNKNLPEHRLTR
jgi:hypothetical protein